MRWGVRVLPLDELERRYLVGRCGWLAGGWVDEPLLDGLSAPSVIAELGLCYAMPDGSRPFAGSDAIGVIRFPISDEVLSRSALDRSAAFGGSLPDPPAGAAWLGNGFAVGTRLIPEYRLGRVEAPPRTELELWRRTERTTLRRRLGGAWQTL